MRTIKFRGWNGKEMIYYNNWFTLHRQSVLCFEEDEEHSYVDESDVDYPDRVILMQFTGLLDRNGVEIYENDIVRTVWNKGITFELGTIIFEKGMFTLDTVREQLNEDFVLEVIGNIYENPELLENTK